jgi:hypothetical protein
MSDKLENFIRNNREKFDQQNPGSEVWNNINTGLANQAAAGASSAGTAATATKGGLAKIATVWKVAATAILAVATGTVIYIAATNSGGGDKNTDNQAIAATSPDSSEADSGNKIELVEASGPLVNPPLPAADVDFMTFSVNAKKGGSWTAPSGTVINVPKGVFVDADGKQVKGDVELQYREFHDAADIILSGIPMTYDNHGTKENFQTAGMMEINGFQNGQPVFIAEGKSIDVSIGSYTPDDDYNLYFLDPEQKQWIDIGRAEIQDNGKKKKGLQMLGSAPEAPVEPSKGIPGKPSEHELGFAADYQEFPELKPFKKIRWEPQDRAFMKKNEWAFTEVWTSIELQEVSAENMEYRFNLKNRKRKFSISVTPILEGEDYDKAMTKFQKKKANYDKLVVQRKQEKSRLVAQADLLRSFPISGFGIYNCDRFLNMPDIVTINAKVEFPEEFYMDPSKTVIYQVTGDNRAVLTRMGHDFPSFRYPASDRNFLVVILPGAKVGIVDDKAFKAVDPYALGKDGKHTFKVKVLDQEIHSASDLRLILGV